jgi:hypothetical protein
LSAFIQNGKWGRGVGILTNMVKHEEMNRMLLGLMMSMGNVIFETIHPGDV